MLEWIKANIALILLIALLLILLIWAIHKAVKYYRSHICDWAAKRLAKCVPASQCSTTPVYVQAHRCPQVQIGQAVQVKPVVPYASITTCAQAAPCQQAAQYTQPQYVQVTKRPRPLNGSYERAVEEAKRVVVNNQAQDYAEAVQVVVDEQGAIPQCGPKF